MNKKLLILAAVPIAALGWLGLQLLGGGIKATGYGTADEHVVSKGPLRVIITESATLYAATSENLRSEVEGRTRILWLIGEGETVKAGDKVCELDVSTIKDKEDTQTISVSRARAEKIQAEKSLEIQKNQNASDIETASNEVLFARLEHEKFLGRSKSGGRVPAASEAATTNGHGDDVVAESREMGEMEQQLVEARANIELAEEELKRAKTRLEWTVKLHANKYVTDSDLETDQLSEKKAEKNRLLALNKEFILRNYTITKTERELSAKVKEAEAELERVKLRCEAMLAQEQAKYDQARQQLDLEETKLKKYREQIKAGTILAPTPGLVVYGTADGRSRRPEPVAEGSEVQERQTIIILPDVTSMRVKASIHEAQIDKVRMGQRVTMRVDTFPDKTFFGEVRRVAVVPDSNQSWFSPDVKVYATTIELFGDTTKLRPGQSSTVHIDVADLKDVLAVPIQAIHRQGKVLYVWKRTPQGPVAHVVKTGISNDQFVLVTEGVAEGDHIALSEPKGIQAPEFAELNQSLLAAEQQAEAAGRKSETGNGERGPRSTDASDGPGEKQPAMGERGEGRPRGQGPGQGAGNAERMAQTQAFLEAARQRFPDQAAALADMRALFSNQELRQKLFDDPELQKHFPELIERWKNMGNRAGGGRRGGGGEGETEGRPEGREPRGR
jgi:HlyD family secretion protein